MRHEDTVIGVAPLRLKEKTASLVGSADVCDYLDFVLAPGKGEEFFAVLIDHLSHQGIRQLDLQPLRPESAVFTTLLDVARERGWEVSCTPEDVTLELELPGSWDEYLLLLDKKQRHEIRRKLRRLHEAGQVRYRVVEEREHVRDAMETFFRLFETSRRDKAAFMTAGMASFFSSLADAMAEVGLLRLCFLDIDEVPAAAVMCFDYDETVYLYNSGFDPRFRQLSPGLLCKVLNIQDSIVRRRRRYDFLKGSEIYKNRLGGRQVPLYRCEIRHP